jgi:putative ABC transport system permease protein
MDSSNVRLFRHFILRHLAGQRLRAAATVFGVAVGVAVVVAIRMANASSVEGFEDALEAVSGRASLEIVGRGAGLDEKLLEDLGWLRAFGSVAPVIAGDVVVRSSLDDDLESLRILGIDILKERPFRDYDVEELRAGDSEPGVREWLALLVEPDAIVLTRRFADRHDLKTGDAFEVVAGDRVHRLRIRGLLEAAGAAQALGGSIAIMDIASAQALLGQPGRIDRLEVRLAEGASVDEAERAVSARLPSSLSVQRPERRGRQVEKMLAAFQFNLGALSHIALIVGLFLVYNTIAISVIARREEIGMLRALGVSRIQVLSLFLGEAAALAALGGAAGLALGPLLARGAVALTGRTVTALYVGGTPATPHLEWEQAAVALAVAMPLALLAAAIPSLEASRVPPTAVIRRSDRVPARYRLQARQFILPVVSLISAWMLSRLGPVNGLPVFGFLAAVAIVIGTAALVPPALVLMLGLCRRPVAAALGIEGRLARASLASAVPRISISVAALAVSLSMMVAVAVMVGSFRETVIYWVNQTLKADLYVAPARTSRTSQATVSPELEALVRAQPGVAAIDAFRAFDMQYNDRVVVVGSGDFRTLLDHGTLLFKTPSDGRRAMADAIGHDAVVVSESFAVHEGLTAGDAVVLPTRGGPVRFEIKAVYYDYSNDRGVLVMDRATLTRYFGEIRPTSLSVYLGGGTDPERVRDALAGTLGGRHLAFIHTNGTLRRQVLRVFDRTFAITYALEAIAVFVAILGVAGTMLTLVIERSREIGMLRLVGASRRQVRRMVLVEAALVGLAGQAVGVLCGLLLSLVLIYVINVQSFGWSIQFHLPFMFLLQSSLVVLATTALAGLWPARYVMRLDPARQVVEI